MLAGIFLWMLLPGAFAAGNDWMAGLDGGTRLSQFTIPGTHDSGARIDHPLLSGTAKTQDFSIAEQLNFGVRYLDIRCRHISDSFAIHHGAVFQEIFFGDVLNQVYAFLDAHPSECVIMKVQEEYDPEGNTRSFEDTFDSYVAANPAKWSMGASVPELDTVRGKIVLIPRFTTSVSKGINGNFLRWYDDYVVEDNAAKWNQVLTGLTTAAADANADLLHLNHGSGYYPGFLGIPDIPVVSDYINPRIDAYFAAATPGHYGCMIMDFATAARCQLIYSANVFPSPDDRYEPNDTLAAAFDLSGDETRWLSALDGIGLQADEDWYEISVTPGYELVQIQCSFQHAAGDIDISLVDSGGTRLALSQSTTDDEEIEFQVPAPGTYYIRIYYGNAGNTYDLWWDDIAPPLSVNADLSSLAVGAGSLSPAFDPGTSSYSLSVAHGVTSTTVTPTLADPKASVEVRVNGGGFIPVSSGAVSAPLALDVGANPVEVRVTAENGGTRIYTVTVTRAAPPDDPYEGHDGNNTLATAFEWSDKENVLLSSLGGLALVADEDWFQIEVSPGEEEVHVRCLFQHALGDIDVGFYDGAGTLIASSDSITDDEEIRTPVPVSGTYYIRVIPFPADSGHRNTYDLWWDDLPQPIQLTEIRHLGGNPARIGLSWESRPGAVYLLEGSGNLSVWTPIGGNQASGGTTTTVEVPLPEPAPDAFFVRVRLK